MAINIFSGSSGKGKINTATNSSRAQAAKSALTGPSEVSSSGNTAVKTSGTLAKVGNTVGKIAGIAAKFLPGIGGTIASGISNLLNDPEWWQSVPGDAITLNSPLRDVDVGTLDVGDKEPKLVPAYMRRFAIGETVVAWDYESLDDPIYVMDPTEMSVTQYLMPQIRKVVNAIPLQSADKYQTVIKVNATIYALWRQLKKIDYMLKHGQTYLANMNDVFLPLYQVENAAFLQSTINRLEEYLRANVRLPHTLCEYLSWRYGRVYKSNDSAKAGLIMHNVLSITATPSQWSQVIGTLMSVISSDAMTQQANTDIYNAYYEHDFMVEIKDETQFTFDCKEFMLRTNMNLTSGDASKYNMSKNAVCIDSRLDNPTTFMASTVSTIGVNDAGEVSCLFPVRGIYGYLTLNTAAEASLIGNRFNFANGDPVMIMGQSAPGSIWAKYSVRPAQAGITSSSRADNCEAFLTGLMVCKSLDIYNKGLYIAATDNTLAFDMSALSIDMGIVDERVLGIEHVYAFANLVDIDRKTSMSYQKAEKLVAKDTAELVDKLDISTVSDKK